ncbi:helix-turn-helix domain-containing protein [Nocardioides pantholopis]|uniref:helix-turn-helix domain-containing protein n=1 Tax=Nocardioides pantholopis TaxID=2483798 RepID=UPI000F075FF2|nr:helix-turn-helix domain-containing protein [Nocardioides pantholopis]
MSELMHDQSTVQEPSVVEVRRNAGLAGAVGGVASIVAILYLSRAAASGAWLDWALCLVMGAVAAAYLQAFVDARTPLLVADALGVRVRQGRAWHGMPWADVEAVETRARHGFTDGWLEVFPRDGEPVSVPLSLSTRVVGDEGDLTGALLDLAGDTVEVVEIVDEVEDAPDSPDSVAGVNGDSDDDPAPDALDPLAVTAPEAPQVSQVSPASADDHPDVDRERLWDPRPSLARGITALSARLRRTPADTSADSADSPAVEDAPDVRTRASEPALPVASATPSPLRDPVPAARVEIRSDLTLGANALRLDPAETEDGSGRGELPEARELRRPGSVSLFEDTVAWGPTVSPIARAGEPVEPIVIEDFPVEPAVDPVIGPELAAARTRLGLSVDQLADRTRIRPHVIESIEVDDFAPCGGDFYARGHLRTLARVLGADVAPLLAAYDERYADAPINPRRVFEAELATGPNGGIRGTRGGPNWSVLVAAVMVLVLAWSVARLVMDGPTALNDAPPLNGSGGIVAAGDPVPVVLDAAGGGAAVKVVDGTGRTVFDGDLAFGQTRVLRKVVTPVRVTSSDGSLKITLADGKPVEVGKTGSRSSRTFDTP